MDPDLSGSTTRQACRRSATRLRAPGASDDSDPYATPSRERGDAQCFSRLESPAHASTEPRHLTVDRDYSTPRKRPRRDRRARQQATARQSTRRGPTAPYAEQRSYSWTPICPDRRHDERVEDRRPGFVRRAHRTTATPTQHPRVNEGMRSVFPASRVQPMLRRSHGTPRSTGARRSPGTATTTRLAAARQ